MPHSKPTNVDYEEIDKFSQVASQWWDLEGEFKPLHAINPLRLSFIEKQTSLNNKIIADIGCGGGILSESLAKIAHHVTGIDLAEQSLEVAREHAALNNLVNIDYHCISVEQFAEQHPESFDVVTCMEMLEHVPDPESIVRACAHLTKPQGYVFLSTLNRNTKTYLEAIIAAEYLLGLVPKGTHNFQKFIQPAELARMCRNTGLEIIALGGFSYNPLTQSYYLCDSTQVNYMLACRKIS